jgi:enamine deaminase RidA (YjgF/YER057c/UK114 family)
MPAAQFFGSAEQFPISRCVRAGDLVITCALGDAVLQPEDAVYDHNGNPVATGRRRHDRTFAEEVHGTFAALAEALAFADCTLADVIDMQVWLSDPRDFPELNRIYAGYFTSNKPTRSVFRAGFMLDFRIELKATAYKPVGSVPAS